MLERLEQQSDKKLIIILGQAAQGKSTLAFSYVNASKVPSAWMNLGPEDSEAVTLFYLLVQSLERALPEIDLSPLLSYPTLPAGPREEMPLYRDWLLALLSRIQSPVQVVFDGLDRLAPQAAAFRFLQVLLEVAPPHLHLLMLSREMPPLRLQELKVRQEVYLMGNEDLAFTAKETRNFFQTLRRLLFPYDLIVRINEFTEGWIGGLVLLCETLERMPAESREKYLSRETTEKFAAEVPGYFEECIFSSRSEESREFLMKSSILEVVDPDFIKDYLGVGNARDIMEELSAKNLFVQPIFDKQRGWLYRYHQLFQDFLQARFRESLSPEQQASAYFRAGSLLAEMGDLESAVDFYLQAGATDQAVAAIEGVGLQLLKQAKTAELARWLQNLLGMAKQFTLDIRQGYPICRHASFLARNAGERHLEIQALIYGKVILSSVGDFTAAQETSHQIDALLADWISPELQVLQLLSTAQLKIFRGEVEEAAALVNMVMEEAAQHGLTFMYPLIQLHRFMSLGYLGKYAEAVKTGRNLLNLPFSPASVLQGIISLHLAIFFYHMGDLAGAGEFVARIHKILAAGQFGAEYHLHCLQVVDSLISYNLEELDPATERKLEKTLVEVTGISSYFFMVDAHWALALWRWRQGRLEEAAVHIQAGMEVAAQRGSYYSITLSPRDQGRIFTMALELAVEEVWDSLPPLLSRWSDWVGPDLDRLSQHANPKVAARAWEIRRAIRRQHLPRLQIQTLGRFRLLRPQGPKDEAVWEGKQPKLLLKALVAHGASGVPKDVLLEALWPEGDPEVTEKNFRVSLHRLRKALEPKLDKGFGSSYLHTADGLLSLDPELCRLDVTEFLSLYASGENQEEQGNLNQAISFYKEALALYGGDFLPEELYLPWAEKRRAELRGAYLELLDRMSRLYEQRGTLGRAIEYCKKAVQADPGLEPAYRRLMTLYARRGMRAEALRTYEACKKALARELDAAPDEVTTAIFRKIQESN